MRAQATRKPAPRAGRAAAPAPAPAAGAPAAAQGMGGLALLCACLCLALLLVAGVLSPSAAPFALRGAQEPAGAPNAAASAAPFALRGAQEPAGAPSAAAPALPYSAPLAPLQPPPAPSQQPRPSPFPPPTCHAFQDTLATAGTTLLQMVRVEGVSPPVQMYLLAHAPEAPLEIEAAMTRTEAMMAAAYKKILLDPYWAARPAPAASALVEVGVHGGWFTTLAHVFGGHRVVGFDMQPFCVLVARCALQVNGATSSHSVILNRFVSHGSATLDVSSSSCGGGLGVGNRARGEVAVQPVHLGRFFGDPANIASLALNADFEVPILKSDTEGFEGIVLETVLPMLGRVHNILLEVFGILAAWHCRGARPGSV